MRIERAGHHDFAVAVNRAGTRRGVEFECRGTRKLDGNVAGTCVQLPWAGRFAFGVNVAAAGSDARAAFDVVESHLAGAGRDVYVACGRLFELDVAAAG